MRGKSCDFFRKFKVKTKLISSFIVVSLIIAIVGIIGIVSLKTVDVNSEEMYSNRLQSVYMLTDMERNLTKTKSDLLQLVYIKYGSKKNDLEKDIQLSRNKDDKYIENYEKLSMNNTEKQIWPGFKNQFEQYRTLNEGIIKFVDDGNFNQAVKQYEQECTMEDAMFASLDKLISTNVNDAEIQNSNNHSVFLNNNKIMIILIIAGLLIAVGLALLLNLDIVSPLILSVENIKIVAKVDLTTVIPDKFMLRKDEIGELANAIYCI